MIKLIIPPEYIPKKMIVNAARTLNTEKIITRILAQFCPFHNPLPIKKKRVAKRRKTTKEVIVINNESSTPGKKEDTTVPRNKKRIAIRM